MYNSNQLYATPVKRYCLVNGSNNLQNTSSQQEIHYRTHQHLHKNICFNPLIDTPSTPHTTKAATLSNRNAQNIGQSAVPCLKEGALLTEQRHSRTNSKILSIKELKQQKVRMHQRVASQYSAKSTSTNRKLFVTISKSNNRLSQQKGVLLNSDQAVHHLQLTNRKIKLTKYLELCGAKKTVQQ